MRLIIKIQQMYIVYDEKRFKIIKIIIVMFATALSNQFDFNISLEDEHTPMVDHSPPRSAPEDISIQQSSIYCYSTCGKRSANLDQFAFSMCDDFHVVALFDGHGNETVSLYLKEHLLDAITKHPLFLSNPLQITLICLRQIQQTIISDPFFQNSGSTALIIIILRQKVIVVNVGDSLAIGLTKNQQQQMLNNLHNLQNINERDTILQKKGLILKSGGCYRLNGKLALSRSIGDRSQKEYISSEPEIKVYENVYSKIVLVSDGIHTGKTTIEQMKERTKGSIEDNGTYIEIRNPY